MKKRRTKVRAGLVGLFALVLMTVGLGSASAIGPQTSIWAESSGCETVTIHYEVNYTFDLDLDHLDAVELPAFNAQGTVNGDVKNGNGVWSTEIVFNGVAAGAAAWSGSMWWDGFGLEAQQLPGGGQYFNQGTVDVDPCPVTTTPTTQPESTTSSTIAQVETDLPTGGNSPFGLTAALAAVALTLLGGTTIVASRRNG